MENRAICIVGIFTAVNIAVRLIHRQRLHKLRKRLEERKREGYKNTLEGILK